MVRPAALALALVLTGCGGSEPAEAVAPDERAEQPKVERIDPRAGIKSARGAGGPDEAAKADLTIESLQIEPEKPGAGEDLLAVATVPTGLTPPVELEFTWFVDEERILDVRSERLRADRIRAGAKVWVVARVTDGDGRSAEKKSKTIQVANGTPVILTDLRRVPDINGKELEAEDPDGDPITWSIVSGPPGISIDAKGRIRVRTVHHDQAWAGELVIAASDPHGAKAELHLPVSISAGRAATVEKKEVQELRRSGALSDEELAKSAEAEVDRTMKSSEKDLDEYEKKRDSE